MGNVYQISACISFIVDSGQACYEHLYDIRYNYIHENNQLSITHSASYLLYKGTGWTCDVYNGWDYKLKN